MTKYTLYDGITKPRTIDVDGIVRARAYVAKWVGNSMSEISSILIVQGVKGKALGTVRGDYDGKLRWSPRTTSPSGHQTEKWVYRLNKDGTLGKKLGRL